MTGPSRAVIVNLDPDWCKTPPDNAPVPYNIIAFFEDETQAHSNVQMTYLPTVTKGSRISRVVGDEAGTGGGLTSGVCGGWCRPVEGSVTVHINGKPVMCDGHNYHMNCAGPDGPGNCVGEVIYLIVDAHGTAVNAATGAPIVIGVDASQPMVYPETPEEQSWLSSITESTAFNRSAGVLLITGGGTVVVGGAAIALGGVAILASVASVAATDGLTLPVAIGFIQTGSALVATGGALVLGGGVAIEQGVEALYYVEPSDGVKVTQTR